MKREWEREQEQEKNHERCVDKNSELFHFLSFPWFSLFLSSSLHHPQIPRSVTCLDRGSNHAYIPGRAASTLAWKSSQMAPSLASPISPSCASGVSLLSLLFAALAFAVAFVAASERELAAARCSARCARAW